MSLALIMAIGGLTAVGVFLITTRSLSRMILGFALLGHAAVLGLLTAGGPPGTAPVVGGLGEGQTISNPIPQALALTAIVISFGLTLFLLALGARQQLLTGDDLVEDDLEDKRTGSRLTGESDHDDGSAAGPEIDLRNPSGKPGTNGSGHDTRDDEPSEGSVVA